MIIMSVLSAKETCYPGVTRSLSVSSIKCLAKCLRSKIVLFSFASSNTISSV